jgi:nucleotide-binding universal stress UspA family protein
MPSALLIMIPIRTLSRAKYSFSLEWHLGAVAQDKRSDLGIRNALSIAFMPSQISLKHVIWAVDVFEQNTKMQRLAARALKELVKRTHAKVDLVYVLKLDESDLSIAGGFSQPSRAKEVAAEALRRMIADCGFDQKKNEITGQVLSQDTVSLGFDHRVDPLVEYVKNVGADSILVSTHGRTGIRRVLLGSFAEMLLLRSPVPVFTIGPKIKRVYSCQRLIFPTDLSPSSKFLFKKVVKMARELSSHLYLYHCASNPVEPILQSGIYLLSGSWVPLYPNFGDDIDQKIRRVQAWTRWALMQGVYTEYIIHATTGSLSEAINSIAKEKKAGLILLEKQSGPISSALLGSIVRQVVRHSPCPVLTLKPFQVADEKHVDETTKKAA